MLCAAPLKRPTWQGTKTHTSELEGGPSRGTWLTPSVEHPTPDFGLGHDLGMLELSPLLSRESAWGPLPLPLPLWCTHMHPLKHTNQKTNKQKRVDPPVPTKPSSDCSLMIKVPATGTGTLCNGSASGRYQNVHTHSAAPAASFLFSPARVCAISHRFLVPADCKPSCTFYSQLPVVPVGTLQMLKTTIEIAFFYSIHGLKFSELPYTKTHLL